MNTPEIKLELDERGIPYKSNQKKAYYADLLIGKDPPLRTAKPVKTRYRANILFDITLTTADGEKHDTQITIHNPQGCMPGSKVCDTDYIMRSVKESLVKRFGRGHAK